MPIFLIPFIILIGIFAVSAGGDILQNIDLPMPSLRLFPQKSVEKATPKAVSPRPTTISQSPSGPSPPPIQQQDPKISPYTGKVQIASLKKGTPSTITLNTNLKAKESLDLTGWKITGSNGSFSIGLGIEKMNPGITAIPANPIVVTRSDTVQLSGAKGPFGIGIHYRPNICMGYIKNSYDFAFSVSSSCSFQKPILQELLFLPIHCQDFILKKIYFSSCVVPHYPEDPNILHEGTAECASYLHENFTYSSCFAQYQNSPNFTKNAWHIYMNTDFINPRYDLLKLYDANGLLVHTKELL